MWAAGLQIAGSVLPILSYMLWKAYFSGFSFTSARFFGFIFSVPMMPSLVLGGQHLVAVLHLDAVLEAGAVQRALQGLLGEAQTERGGLAAHLLGHGHGGLQHVIVGHHAVGEAPLVELLGIEAGRVHEDLAGAGIADDLREEEGAAHVGAGVADGQVAGVHLVGLAEHAHVAGAGNGQATAHGKALQGRR